MVYNILSEGHFKIRHSQISNWSVLTKPNLWQLHLFSLTYTHYRISNAKQNVVKIWWLEVATEHHDFTLFLLFHTIHNNLSEEHFKIRHLRISNWSMSTKPNLWQLHLFSLTYTYFRISNTKQNFVKICWLEVTTEHHAFTFLIISPL